MARKFWEISNNVQNSDVDAEILLYGPIADDKWWGDEVTAADFQADLKALGDASRIDVRINSGGGSVFAANAICSMLKSHKANIHVTIDGLAASAATIVALAGDTVTMPLGSMMMIHDPAYGLLGYYNVTDMEKLIDDLEKTKDAIMEHYTAKSGKDKDTIYDLMRAETWLTADDAIELGLADQRDDKHPVNMIMDGKKLISNDISFDVEKFSNFPSNRFATKQSPIINNGVQSKPHVKDKEEKIVDIKDLQTNHPSIYNEVFNLGVKNERERIKAINGLNDMGHPDIKNAAMFESDESAGDVAMKIINANQKLEEQHQNDVKDDVANSGMDDVNPEKPENKEDASKEKVNLVANAAKALRGIK